MSNLPVLCCDEEDKTWRWTEPTEAGNPLPAYEEFDDKFCCGWPPTSFTAVSSTRTRFISNYICTAETYKYTDCSKNMSLRVSTK